MYKPKILYSLYSIKNIYKDCKNLSSKYTINSNIFQLIF